VTLVAGRLGLIVAAPAVAIGSDLLCELHLSGLFAPVADRRLVPAQSGDVWSAAEP
jgi:hypothetical protein